VLASVKDSLLADDYANYIADRLFADFSTVRRAVAAAQPAAGASRAQEADEYGPGPAAPSEVDSQQLRAERELLDLLVRTPRLREKASFLLDENLLTDERSRVIAETIANSDPALSPAALVGVIESQSPGASEALSGATLVEVGDDEAETVERELLRKLKEFDLERRIAVGKARLKKPDSFKDKAEEAEVFKNVSAFQRELDELRTGTRDVG